MAIAFDAATNGGTTDSGTSLTFSMTLGATATLLCVAVQGDVDTSPDSITGVTYNGVAMTLAAKTNLPANGTIRWNYLWYLFNPSTGAAHDVVVSASATINIQACAASYSGAGSLDATVVESSETNVDTLETEIVSVADNCWAVFSSTGYNGGNAPTAGTGLTRRSYATTYGGVGLFDSNAAITPAGSFLGTVNRSSADNGMRHVVATFAPAAPAPARRRHAVLIRG